MFMARYACVSSAHIYLFVGSENRSAPNMQFQLFARARGDGFLGKIDRR